MKQIVLLLILFPALSFGQSKKELREQIVSLQLDSANQDSVINNLREVISNAEQTIVNQQAEIGELLRVIDSTQNIINALSQDLSEKQLELDSAYEELIDAKTVLFENKEELAANEVALSSLENEVFNLTLEKEMLQVQLDSITSVLSVQEQGQSIYNSQVPFDFQYIYEGGNGYNPPEIYPIGWSNDGKIAYVGDNCDGGCGCCSSYFVILDLKTNAILEQKEIATEELSSMWEDSEFLGMVTGAIAKYDIIPLGFGQLNPSNHIERPGPIGVDIYITLEKSDDRYRIFDDGNYHQPITSGSLESYTIDGEIFCKPDVEYVGHIVSPIGNYAAMILMHKQPCQFEGEINYYPEFIGAKLD